MANSSKPMAIKRYEWQGRLCTITELAEATGIRRGTLQDRLKRGMSVEEAVRYGNGVVCKLYSYHGEMLPLAEISARSGTAKQTIWQRLHRGWSVEEAADTSLHAGQVLARSKRTKVPDTIDLRTISGRRCKAAKSIALQIATDSLDGFNFRCILPMLKYAFDGLELSYNISFDSTAEKTTARLSARYPDKNISSTLNRVYVVNKDTIKEVQMT